MDDRDIRAITVIDNDGKPTGICEAPGSAERQQAAPISPILSVLRAKRKIICVLCCQIVRSNTSWMPSLMKTDAMAGEISRGLHRRLSQLGPHASGTNIHETANAAAG